MIFLHAPFIQHLSIGHTTETFSENPGFGAYWWDLLLRTGPAGHNRYCPAKLKIKAWEMYEAWDAVFA